MSEAQAETSEHRLSREFRFFADMCCETAPLYAALSARVAADRSLLDLAARSARRQPPANMFFGAVQYLLLSGVEHPLRGFYPSVGGRRDPDEAFPELLDFCHEHQSQLIELIESRRVQTNEVGRSALLLPAFAKAQEAFDGLPLFLIELGASAGLNLLFDRFHFEYMIDERIAHTCGPASPVWLRVELRQAQREELGWLPQAVPAAAERAGIDIAPIDVTDDDALRWTESLIWADHTDRLAQFRAAVRLAREDPPRLIAGDARELIPDLVRSSPRDVLPCVFHSHAIYQWKEADRAAFLTMLDDLGAHHDFAHVSLEWLGDDPGPQLHLTTHKSGEKRLEHLADCHHHGRWMRWLAV